MGKYTIPDEFIDRYIEPTVDAHPETQFSGPTTGEFKIPGKDEKELNFSQKLAQFPYGLAQTAGSLADSFSEHALAPAIKAREAENIKHGVKYKPEVAKENYEKFKNPKGKEYLTGKVEDVAGAKLEPEENDMFGKIRVGIGQNMFPTFGGTAAVSAAKAGIKPLSKFLGKELAQSAGATTAIHATPKLAEEGTGLGILEDMAKAMIGANQATKASKLTSEFSKSVSKGNLKRSIGKKIGDIKDIPLKVAAKVASKSSKPQPEIFELAKKYDIELPANVGMRSTPLNFAQNNFLKSMFTSQVYKDVYRKSDENMFKNVKDSIDTLGTSNYKPSEASARFRDFLKQEKSDISKESDKLYKQAESHLSSKDSVTPKHTAEFLNSEVIRNILNAPVTSSETSLVAKTIGQLGKKWGLIPDKTTIGQIEDNPSLLVPYLSALSNRASPKPIKQLTLLRSELGKIASTKENRGMVSQISKLKKAVDADIESSSNAEFKKKWDIANKYRKDEYYSRVKSDLARSMLNGEAPTEAFDIMSDVQGIKAVGKISGETEKGKKVFQELKKAKIREIMGKAIEGDLEDGTIKKAAFSKIFQKGEKNQEVLEELLGKEQYNKLSEISKIANEFSHSGKELLNTSGSALAHADISRIENIIKSSLQQMYGFAGGVAAGYAAADVPGAIMGAASPYLLSRLLSNKKFVNEARAYALQRAKGKEKDAIHTLNRMVRDARKEEQAVNVFINEMNKKEESKKEKSK